MTALLSQEELGYLKTLDSPTVANGVEVFDLRPRTDGYTLPGIHAMFPEFGSMVGYAVTGVISSKQGVGRTVPRAEMFDHVLSIPGPRIVVLQDIDEPSVGSFWGEVQSNVFSALGCLGCVTNGSVRDLDEARAKGFQFCAGSVCVSHGYVHLVDVGVPVTIRGLPVSPGDIIHADKHGVVQVPVDAAKGMHAAVDSVLERERRIIEHCNSPDFSVERLKELAG